MTEQQMTPHQALSALISAIQCGEIFDAHHKRAVEVIRAALSHAEGEAQPVAWGLKWSEDVSVNPHTVFRTEAHAQAYRAECQSADTIMVVPLYTRPAPQVAVPEGWRHALEEALAMMTSQSMTLERQADAVTGIRDLLAAPTAPAGEPEPDEKHPWTARLAQTEQRTPIEALTGDLGTAIENMGAHPLLTDAQTLVNEALCTLGAWHDQGEPGGTGQQPVSDPDGFPSLTSTVVNDACWGFIEAMPHQMPPPIFNDLKPALYEALKHYHRAVLSAPTPDERDQRITELESTLARIEAKDFEALEAAQARIAELESASDEREIAGAIKALEVVGTRINSEVVQFGGATANETGAKAAYRVVQNEIARLRAGKEGE